MSTWHQDKALRRHFDACREAGKPLSNPYAHETRWTVMTDPPGGMKSAETFTERNAAYENAGKAPHRYVIAPRSST